MFNTVAGKRIAVFGFAFKANTGDTRESPATRICRQLHAERASVAVTDPQALENAARDLEDLGDGIQYEPDPYRAAEGAHAILVVTEWDTYRELDYARIYAAMEKPAFIFDGRNILDQTALRELGFQVYAIGKPESQAEQ
jgi:UDPglucose 6-dehydrogenase